MRRIPSNVFRSWSGVCDRGPKETSGWGRGRRTDTGRGYLQYSAPSGTSPHSMYRQNKKIRWAVMVIGYSLLCLGMGEEERTGVGVVVK